MTRESIAQETAAAAPRGKVRTRYTCPLCNKELVHKRGRDWVHRDDNTPCSYHVMQLRFTRPFSRGE